MVNSTGAVHWFRPVTLRLKVTPFPAWVRMVVVGQFTVNVGTGGAAVTVIWMVTERVSPPAVPVIVMVPDPAAEDFTDPVYPAAWEPVTAHVMLGFVVVHWNETAELKLPFWVTVTGKDCVFPAWNGIVEFCVVSAKSSGCTKKLDGAKPL
jgi:hypothetical protein